MKKQIVALTVALLIALTVLMTGCSLVKVLEKDVQLILYDRDTYVGTYTVNAFNNAYVSQPLQAPQKGYKLAGWTPKENWDAQTDSLEMVTANALVIRYDDVKDYGKSTLIMYAAYAPIPQHDIAIAWYDKESTSGLNQSHIDTFTNQLYEFLRTKGYDPDTMDIVIRGYQGNVGTTCADIKDDGDIDIMIGWSTTSNLTGTGGMVEGVDFLDNYGGVQLYEGAKARYAARLTNKELTNLVYLWIFEQFATEVPNIDTDPEEPEEPVEPVEDQLVIAWYAKSTTSGIEQANMDKLQADLSTFLTTKNYKQKVVVRAYGAGETDNDVAATCAQIRADGDVDIMIGWSKTSNLTDTGGMVEGVDFIENNGNVQVGSKARYAARNTDDAVTNLAYNWILSTYSTDVTATEADQLVIAWYAKSATSGIEQANMDALKTAIEQFLQSKNCTIEVVVRAYGAGETDNDVASTCAQIRADGDVDIMIGWSNTGNLTGTGGMVEGVDFIENNGNVQVGTKSRYAVRKTDDDVTNLAYNWVLAMYATSNNA